MCARPLAVLAAVLAQASLLPQLACATGQQPPRESLVLAGDRATVRGVVLRNIKQCEVNGPCYLELRVEGADVRVYYHHGEWPPCENTEATRTGLGVADRTAIEATGGHSTATGVHLIDVCCAECRLAVVARP